MPAISEPIASPEVTGADLAAGPGRTRCRRTGSTRAGRHRPRRRRAVAPAAGVNGAPAGAAAAGRQPAAAAGLTRPPVAASCREHVTRTWACAARPRPGARISRCWCRSPGRRRAGQVQQAGDHRDHQRGQGQHDAGPGQPAAAADPAPSRSGSRRPRTPAGASDGPAAARWWPGSPRRPTARSAAPTRPSAKTARALVDRHRVRIHRVAGGRGGGKRHAIHLRKRHARRAAAHDARPPLIGRDNP